MARQGLAIRCPHCDKWNIQKNTNPKKVALKSVDECEAIMREFLAAKREGRADDFSHGKLFRCPRPRWSCPTSYEAFVFSKEDVALEALKKVPEKWAISRDFRLYKADKKNRWDKLKKYYCIMFCTEPVPRQGDIELELLMDRKLLSSLIVGMSYEIQAPLTIYSANIFEPEGLSPQVYWMPIEAYSEGKLLIPPRYNRFCHTCRGLVIEKLVAEFEANNFNVNNCPTGFGEDGRCARKEAACTQKPKDWNHCPAFIEQRKKRCPCYNSDFAIIKKVEGMWRNGEVLSDGVDHICHAGFREKAFAVVAHDHLAGVAMTGQVFFDRQELVDVGKFTTQWHELQGHDYELQKAKYVLLSDEEQRLQKNEKTRFLMNQNQFKRRLNRLKGNIAKVEEMANIRYRDIRRRSENAFREEILRHIQEYKMAPDFFKTQILNVLKRMRKFWAFRAAAFLWHSSQTKDVCVVGFSSETDKSNHGFGFPGVKIGQIDCEYEQTHPIGWFYEPENPEDPLNPWVKRLLPLLENVKKYSVLNLPEEGSYFQVAVPFAGEVYAFVFIVRDVLRVSRLRPLRPGVLSKVCKEFMLRTCTEVIHELGDVRAFVKERERAWQEFSRLLEAEKKSLESTLLVLTHQALRPLSMSIGTLSNIRDLCSEKIAGGDMENIREGVLALEHNGILYRGLVNIFAMEGGGDLARVSYL